MCVKKQREKTGDGWTPNNLIRVSGAPAPAPPRAVRRQPSDHGQSETYQIINKRDIYRKILTTKRAFNLMKTLFKCLEKAL